MATTGKNILAFLRGFNKIGNYKFFDHINTEKFTDIQKRDMFSHVAGNLVNYLKISGQKDLAKQVEALAAKGDYKAIDALVQKMKCFVYN